MEVCSVNVNTVDEEALDLERERGETWKVTRQWLLPKVYPHHRKLLLSPSSTFRSVGKLLALDIPAEQCID